MKQQVLTRVLRAEAKLCFTLLEVCISSALTHPARSHRPPPISNSTVPLFYFHFTIYKNVIILYLILVYLLNRV